MLIWVLYKHLRNISQFSMHVDTLGSALVFSSFAYITQFPLHWSGQFLGETNFCTPYDRGGGEGVGVGGGNLGHVFYRFFSPPPMTDDKLWGEKTVLALPNIHGRQHTPFFTHSQRSYAVEFPNTVQNLLLWLILILVFCDRTCLLYPWKRTCFPAIMKPEHVSFTHCTRKTLPPLTSGQKSQSFVFWTRIFLVLRRKMVEKRRQVILYNIHTSYNIFLKLYTKLRF